MKLRHSLATRAMLFLTAISALTFAALGVVQERSIRSERYADVETSAVIVIEALKEVILESPSLYRTETLQPVVQRFANKISNIHRLVAVDALGRVVADSEMEWIGRRIEDPLLAECLAGLRPVHRRLEADGKDVMRVLVPVEGAYDAARKSNILGALRIDMHLMFVDQKSRDDIWRAVAVTGGALLAALGVQGMLLRRAITRPLRRLYRAAERLGAGDLSARAPMPGEDEIGSLSRSFNAMAEHVQVSSRELEAKVGELERARRRQGELLKEVESANRELNEFAYVVSHDLKAPLRGIVALAGWISEDYAGRLDEAGREQLRLLLSRTHRMHDLIDGVLQYSRVGRVRESREAVDLGQLVPGVVDLLALPPHIRVSVESPLPTVVAEKTRIAQVFQNLLGNAAQYSDKEAGEIRIGCSDQGGFWRLSVADNGPGIPEKHFERIFQIFQTLDARDQRGGAGVGLAIVKKVIEIHGGRAWVESQVGCGSTFFFTLPKADGPLSPETCQEPSKCLIT